MNKLVQLPAINRAARSSPRRLGAFRRKRARYFAFLSYSHEDAGIAEWLHSQIEGFRVPGTLAGKLTENGVVPKRLTPIFRDQHELAAADDLGEEIEEALANSQFLIVLCSPAAAKSRWTNAEIETFKRTRPDGCVLAAIAAGEPFASDMPGREAEECFPPALRHKFDRRGRPTARRAEPLAADLRGEGEARRLGLLKLIAGMLGVGLDDLLQRETTRRQRRLAMLAAASLAGMAITSTLAVTAIQARDAAREQRRQAEGLVAFMLGDLKDKLEPIGRLDALDGVGSRVLAYYRKQDTSELPDAALLQRSRALSLMGEVANARGNLNEANRLYTEAMTGTAEAVRRDREDPERLYEHAQNVFWVGDLARQRGDLHGAEVRLRQYKALADRMIQLQPDNLKYRMEEQYADTDLGVVLYYERHYDEAVRQFAGALQTIQAVASIDRSNSDYIGSVAASLAWLADGEFASGHIADAIAHREQQVSLLDQLARKTGDVRDREGMVTARCKLAQLLAASGDSAGAIEQLTIATQIGDELVPSEPGNTSWINDAAAAKLNFAVVLLASGNSAGASAQVNAGCAYVDKLNATNRSVVDFQTLTRLCLMTKAQVASSVHDWPQATQLANRAVAAAKNVRSFDRQEDSLQVARALRILGDIQQRSGDVAGAQSSWRAAAGLLSNNVAERPQNMADRVALLQRLGEGGHAQQLVGHLNAIGYRQLDW